MYEVPHTEYICIMYNAAFVLLHYVGLYAKWNVKFRVWVNLNRDRTDISSQRLGPRGLQLVGCKERAKRAKGCLAINVF